MENLLKNIDNQNGLIDIKYDDTHSHLQKKRTKINHNDVRTTIQMLKKELKFRTDIDLWVELLNVQSFIELY
ncbi:MAG: hypothetical protein L6422_00730, partial [Candidatus Marinimicrobia bacterium]|nr:hypothetical protein [Candidatus Neomarinimicrobiota bacterium]